MTLGGGRDHPDDAGTGGRCQGRDRRSGTAGGRVDHDDVVGTDPGCHPRQYVGGGALQRYRCRSVQTDAVRYADDVLRRNCGQLRVDPSEVPDVHDPLARVEIAYRGTDLDDRTGRFGARDERQRHGVRAAGAMLQVDVVHADVLVADQHLGGSRDRPRPLDNR